MNEEDIKITLKHRNEAEFTNIWQIVDLLVYKLRSKNYIDVNNKEETEIKDKIWNILEKYEVIQSE
jgi:hypothetical protein